MALSTSLPLLSPRFHTWSWWVGRELAHGTLLLLMGIELAVRLFFRVPHVQRLARLWILAVVGAVLLVLLTTPPGPLMTGLLPRVVFALVCLYAGLASVAVHHFVPVDPLHNVVLRGFALYMGVYGLTWSLTVDDARLTGYVNAIAFDLLMLVLLRAAWRRDDVPAHLPRRTVEHFWPWRRHERRDTRERRRAAQPRRVEAAAQA